MITDQFNTFVGQLVLSLALPMFWLGARRILRPLRRRIGISRSYGIAVLVALGACVLPLAPIGYSRLAAGGIVAGLLYLAWKRSLRNGSLKADTIVSYFSDTVIGRH